MGPDFPIGECYTCLLIYLAENPKMTSVQPARVLINGTGYCRAHVRRP
jgi:hypothetical protein